MNSQKYIIKKGMQHTLFKSIKASADRARRIVLLRGYNIAEEGILVGDKWRLETRLCLLEVVECDGGRHGEGLVFL